MKDERIFLGHVRDAIRDLDEVVERDLHVLQVAVDALLADRADNTTP